jgi:hypothetical protein
MTEPDTTRSQGLGLVVLMAAGVLVVGVAGFSIRALWQAGKRPRPAIPAAAMAPEASRTAPEEPALPAPAMPAAAAPEAARRNLELDPHTMLTRQELSRQQAQAFRTIARESTNLSFQLTEQEIQAMEKEGVRVQ